MKCCLMPPQINPRMDRRAQYRLVVHGGDFEEEKMAYYYEVPIALNIFRTVPYTKGVSTSQLIKRIKEHVEA